MATIGSTGVFSGLGGDVIVSVDIVPSPEIIESQLMEAAHNLEDTMKPMLTAKRVAQEDIQAHFDTESDPDGTRWIELDSMYLRRKEAAGKDTSILRREGTLEAAAVSDAAFTVTPYGLFYNWDALPKDDNGNNIGQILQAGTTEGTVRATSIEELLKQSEAGDTFGSGRGKSLPPRPFVGMSEAAEASFWTIFDVWFDESVDVVVNPKTGVMQRRGVGGRFGRTVV